MTSSVTLYPLTSSITTATTFPRQDVNVSINSLLEPLLSAQQQQQQQSSGLQQPAGVFGQGGDGGKSGASRSKRPRPADLGTEFLAKHYDEGIMVSTADPSFHECSRCGARLPSLQKRITHELRIHGIEAPSSETPFPCHLCDRRFANAGARRQHIKRNHQQPQLQQHQSTAPNGTTPSVVGGLFDGSGGLPTFVDPSAPAVGLQHFAEAVQDGAPPVGQQQQLHQPPPQQQSVGVFHCQLCDKSFAEMGNLKRHMASGHFHKKRNQKADKDLLYPCRHCGLLYRLQSSRYAHECRMHRNVSVDVSALVAAVAGSVAPSGGQNSSMITAEQQQLTEFACRFCDRTFNKHNSRYMHEIRRHRGEPGVTTSFMTPPDEPPKTYECHHCGRVLKTSGARRMHIRRSHILGQQKSPTIQKLNSGGGLDAIIGGLQFHDQPTYPCRLCGRVYARSDSRYAHEQRTHLGRGRAPITGDNCHLCKLCGSPFGSSMGLSQHYRMIHSLTKSEQKSLASVEAPAEGLLNAAQPPQQHVPQQPSGGVKLAKSSESAGGTVVVRAYPCRFCNRVYSYWTSRYKHEREDHAPKDMMRQQQKLTAATSVLVKSPAAEHQQQQPTPPATAAFGQPIMPIQIQAHHGPAISYEETDSQSR